VKPPEQAEPSSGQLPTEPLHLQQISASAPSGKVIATAITSARNTKLLPTTRRIAFATVRHDAPTRKRHVCDLPRHFFADREMDRLLFVIEHLAFLCRPRSPNRPGGIELSHPS
jgi:hypothetical protein